MAAGIGERKLKLVENPPVVEIRDVTKDFGTVRALDHVNLDIPEGRIIGLLGPNGSGKTTLLKILAGFYAEYEGTALIDGHKPGAFTKARVAYLPDKDGLPENMMVNDIIKIYKTFFDDFDEEKCRRLLETFDVRETAMPKEMSKGVIDKLQISLLMARQARLYLLDEPIGGVDPAARDYILRTIIANYAEGATVLISTHLIADVEKVLDEVVFIRNGEIIRHTSVEELREQYDRSVDALFREEFKC